MVSKIKVDKEAQLTPDLIKALVKSIVSKMGPTFSAEEKKEHAKLLLKIFEKGIDPYKAMKLADEDIAQAYLFAYRLFNSGRFDEAAEVFKMLTLLAPMEAGFAVSLGVCYHKLHKFEDAIRSYLLGALTDLTDPVPYFYAYDCFLNLNDIISAGIMLSNVVTKCGDDPKYAKLKDRATILLDGIEKDIAEKKHKKK